MNKEAKKDRPRNASLLIAGVASLLAGAGLKAGWDATRRSDGGTKETAPADRLMLPGLVNRKSPPGPQDFDDIATSLSGMQQEELTRLAAAIARSRTDGGTGAGAEPVYLQIQDAMLRALFARWAEIDSPGLSAALTSPDFAFAYAAQQQAVNALVEFNGLSMLEQVMQQRPKMAKVAVREMLLRTRDPERTEEFAPHLRGFGSWDFNDEKGTHPSVDIQTWLWMYDLLKSGKIENSPLTTMKAQEILPAMERIKAIPEDRLRNPALAEVLAKALLKAREDKGALFRKVYEALPPGALADKNAGNYARVLALEDPEEALKRARGMKDRKVREWAMYNAGLEAGMLRPSAEILNLLAEVWTVQIPPDEGAMAGIYARWLNAEPQAAEEWLKALPDKVLQALLPPEDTGSPTERALMATSPEGRRRLSAGQLRTAMLLSGPEGLIEHLRRMEPEECSLEALYLGTTGQLLADPKSALRWLKSVPPGEGRDAAISALIDYELSMNILEHSVPLNPAEVFERAAGLQGPAERQTYMLKAARRWAVVDAEAARKAAVAAGLPEDVLLNP